MAEVIKAPEGRQRVKWLGPAFIWMLSAAGSGEVLFTPRIASRYGYALVWALVLSVVMKWCINREIGRYTVCAGVSFFRGLESLAVHGKYLLWVLIFPQVVVAVATVAGLASAAATALIIFFDLPLEILAIILLLLTTSVILIGRYYTVERIASILATVIAMTVLAAAISSRPDTSLLSRGFIPSIPPEMDLGEVLSWLGFMLAGAAGLMWFSYWIEAKGYGAADQKRREPLRFEALRSDQIAELRKWTGQMTIANTIAVTGALIIAFAFLVLGTELLRPRGLMPEENKIAQTLGELLGGIWGRIGFWFMVLAVFTTFVSSMLSGQDGFTRMFTDGVQILMGKNTKRSPMLREENLTKIIAVIVLGIIPAVVCVISGEPVALLKLAGIIEVCHIPVVAGSILWLNSKKLPKELKPSVLSLLPTIIAGVVFSAYGIVYILELLGLVKL
ncbi:Nramp family divalent metal transporter [Dyadobacter sp. MSC1_007]|jgi:Mn2+/Fe2+ NRAMP family transporter|uniref:Nramp family divalent metal transporter n=1 Tax=Dyadobacter sp. MSC1_007 TaxID=2909264 RepID=UPI002548E071|nr:Nramp family divalent metal transporter [Dyadobacter sp. MSC1_007]